MISQFNQTFIISGVIVSGIFVSATIVAHFLNYSKKKELIVNERLENLIDFEKSYYDEFEQLEDISFDKQQLQNMNFEYILESTPVGDIYMCYNIDSETFHYYSNTKDISYRILDTIARKFAIHYNCKSICVNYKKEFYDAKDKIVRILESHTINNDSSDGSSDSSSTSCEDNDDHSVFVKLKSYNTSISHCSNDSLSTSERNITHPRILTEKANRFTFRGKLADYTIDFPSKDSHDNIPLNISFKDYKIKSS